MRSACLLSLLLFVAPAGAAELGLNVHQSSGVGLDITRDAKLGWVRIDLNWLDAQPSNAAPDFSRFDAIVDGARSRGLDVLAVLAYTPAWASAGDTKGDGSTNDVPQAGTYAAFVTATVEHFAGKVTHYELWNEPNLAQFWEGTTQQYIDLVLVPGADAVHAACPTCQVVGPALATVGTAYADWMDAVLTQAADKLDIVSGHDYGQFPSPGSTVGTTSDSFFNRLDQHRVVTVGGVTIYEGPLSFREEMLAHNVQKPFWLTETGLEAPLGDTAKEQSQVDYYRQVLEAMTSRPWWTNTIFYEAFDEPNTGLTWGVALDDPSAPGGYQAKPVLSLLQMASTILSTTPDGGTPDGGATDAAPPADASADAAAPPDAGAPAGSPAPGAGGGTNGTASGGCSLAGASAPALPTLALFACLLLAARLRRRA